MAARIALDHLTTRSASGNLPVPAAPSAQRKVIMQTYTYRVSFLPEDRNVSAEECMPIQHYPTRVEALAAAARDAMATANSECAAHGLAGSPEGRAYMRAAAALIERVACEAISKADAAIGAQVAVHVNGLNPRTIGCYAIDAIKREDNTTPDVNQIADDAIQAGIRSVQDALGVDSGDYASIHFGDREGGALADIFREYASAEIQWATDPTPPTPFSALRVLDRVQLLTRVERFPHFIVAAGETGTVKEIDLDAKCNRQEYWVKMDNPIENCEEWDNCILWTFPDDDDCEETLARL